MDDYITILILGLLCGLINGIIGILPIGLLLLTLDYLNIGEYKANLGAIVLLNLFPISMGAFVEFFKADKINYKTG